VWDDAQPATERSLLLPPARPYRPGHFYERELPPLLAVLGDAAVDAVVVDGYALVGAGVPGLGAMLVS
jgi:deoxyribonuclease V